ncbi:MAG: DinB family protein [Bacteroidales bacterium]|nr:DinB family protein [Bacteroidales bacterium]
MNEFNSISNELTDLINTWEKILSSLPGETITQRRNSQNRTIKQIVGHMIDSATNNTHRTVHLQYQKSPFHFPNYATFGNNDRWIAIQNYQEEDWNDLIQLWKYSNLHFAHIIKNINKEKLNNEWIASADSNISLKDMVSDFPMHFKLHLGEISELINR